MMHFFRFPYILICVATSVHPSEMGAGNERRCLIFDYEEKLLEKIIRMEIKLEQIVEHLEKSKERELTKTTDLERRIGNVETNVMNFQEDIRETLKKFKENVEKGNAELARVAERVLVPSVAFNARLSSSVTKAADAVFVFDTVLTNEGEGYDSATGIFTAPRSGLYYFAAHMCNKGTKYIQYTIVVDNNPIASSTQYDNDYSCSSVTSIVRVKSAERVWVKSLINTSDIHFDPYRWSSFVEISLMQCTAKCSQHGECMGFTYNLVSTQCDLSKLYQPIVGELLESKNGANVYYAVETGPQCNVTYSTRIASESVSTITTSNYPGYYAHDTDQFWLIVKPPRASTLQIIFQTMDKESSAFCKFDSVVIHKGYCAYDDLPIAKLC